MTVPETPAAASPASTPTREGAFARIPLHWLLFAAYPVLFLYSQNLGELTPEEMVVPLLITMALAAVAMLVLSRILDVRRAAIIVSGAVILLCLFGPISDNLHKILPQLALRLGLAVGLGALVVLLALRLRGGLGTATMVLNLLSLVLVLFAIIPIGQQIVSLATAPPETADASDVPVTGTGTGTGRDIWFFILDRYGSDASIKALYDITDNDFGPWLQGKGFTLIKDPHANYVRTSLSIATTLHMSHLDGLAAKMGPDSTKYGPVFKWLLDHPVGRFLQSQGYHYTQLGSWFPQTRSSDIADTMLRPGASRDFNSLVWNATVLPVAQRLLSPGKVSEQNRAQAAALYQWDQLAQLCRQVDHQFVFAHVLLPHPPYVFHADGTVAPHGKSTSYDEQMRYTNTHMEQVIDCLQDRPADQQPIIIIQADEGPYPPRFAHDQLGFDWSQATPSELLAKYSILDAMYLPGLPADASPPPAGMSSVNTFRYLFHSYFGADLPLLPDRSYTSPKLTPYDLTDVTDRIPAAGASLDPIPHVGDVVGPVATSAPTGHPSVDVTPAPSPGGGAPTASPVPTVSPKPSPSAAG